MKKLIIFSMAALFATTGFTQKDKGKNKQSSTTKEEARRVILGEEKGNNKKQETSPDIDIFEGSSGKKNTGGGKSSKNQPAKVRAAFQADYPNATQVRWSKYRGDWTATFINGSTTSTAVYHANGQRKDTRTDITRAELPSVIENIFNKRSDVQVGNIVRIDLPGMAQQIFRIKTVERNGSNITYYDKNGKKVNYDY